MRVQTFLDDSKIYYSFHEECAKNEVFIGNCRTDHLDSTKERLKSLKSLRFCVIAYDIFGNLLEFNKFEEVGYLAMFINKSESLAYNTIMMAGRR